MGDIVSENQNAFVPGRAIADNALAAHELLRLVKKSKRRNLAVFKIDLNKAYDRIRWDFLEWVLTHMQFPPSWIRWIMQCVSTVSYSVLVNGEPTERIVPCSGLRQGDPLSPYLFILCMEVLSSKLHHMQLSGELGGLQISRSAPKVNHLFFADDALFFLEANFVEFRVMKKVLNEFCAISREMVSLQKSFVVFSKHTHHKFKRMLHKVLGVGEEGKLGTYLGCPMDVDGRTTSVFMDLTHKISQKLCSWQLSKLSQAGKLILINGILVAMASHVLSIYMMPKYVLKRINSLLLRFFWSSSMSSRPIYWRKADVIQQHKADGGLGVRNIENLNKALLFKQAWRMHSNPSSLMAQIFSSKYQSSWFENSKNGIIPHSVSWGARSIMRSVGDLSSGLRRVVGDGRQTHITEDVWATSTRLSFKQQGSIDPTRPVWVANLISENRSWKASEIWRHFDPPSARIILATYIPKVEMPDSWDWWPEKQGNYFIRSGYWLLQKKGNHHLPPSRFWASWWKRRVWPKWKLFIWKLINGAISTRQNLRLRNMDVPPHCVMCGRAEETATHLFKACDVSKHIWKASHLGIIADSYGDVDFGTLVTNFLLFIMREDGKEEARIVEFLGTLWSIWIHRNYCLFNNVPPNPATIMGTLLSWKSRWFRSFGKDSNLTTTSHSRQGIQRDLSWATRSPTVAALPTLVIDGAWKARDIGGSAAWEAGIGWALLINGQVIEEEGVRVFANNPNQAEAKALLHAVSRVPLHIRELVIKTDSSMVIKAIKDRSSSEADIRPIISDAVSILVDYDYCKVIKVSRSCVIRAHNLAVAARKGS
ncbi:uncharacterized protein [Spinacia oleracea]|uniref:Reverse transcriptase domain-containing protein n=1 Tax=Spinacia oleracea TaxID=3562 RepID=A0A9R0IBA2_SPIOL|nr:uncharacterized protein LOC110784802 [Spinacia oleracea]